MELFVIDYYEKEGAYRDGVWESMVIVANDEEEAKEVFMEIKGSDPDEDIEIGETRHCNLLKLIEQLKDATSASYLEIKSCKLVALASFLKEREEIEKEIRDSEEKYKREFKDYGLDSERD